MLRDAQFVLLQNRCSAQVVWKRNAMLCNITALGSQNATSAVSNLTECTSGLGLQRYHIPVVIDGAVVAYAYVELDMHAIFVRHLLAYIPNYLSVQDPFVYSHAVLPFFFYILTHSFSLSLVGHVLFELVELHIQQFAHIIYANEIGAGGVVSDLVTGLVATCLANRLVVYMRIPKIVSGPRRKWQFFWRGFFAFCSVWLVSYGCGLVELLLKDRLHASLMAAATGAATLLALAAHFWLLGTAQIVHERWGGDRAKFVKDWAGVIAAAAWISWFLLLSVATTLAAHAFLFINIPNVLLCFVLHLFVLGEMR